MAALKNNGHEVMRLTRTRDHDLVGDTPFTIKSTISLRTNRWVLIKSQYRQDSGRWSTGSWVRYRRLSVSHTRAEFIEYGAKHGWVPA